jgi:FdhD protein
MKILPNQSIQYVKVTANGNEVIDSRIITEANVSLTVNGDVWLSFMCTPIDLEALAVGFLFNEGIIQNFNEIAIVRPCDNSENIDIWLHDTIEKPSDWRRTSGCTGGVTTGTAAERTAAVQSQEVISAQSLLGIMDRLFEAQELYREVRGVHCSILTDGEEILAIAEDIGRHNTLDKIAGIVLMKSLPPGRRYLLTTGRISSEMLQKSVRMGASIIISRTSPSSLSIEMAERLGVTLIGYARRNQFNVYAHPERLNLPALEPLPLTVSIS